MVAQLVRDLTPAVSHDRLQAYRPLGGSDLDMVVTYLWNAALGEAMYTSLGAVVVALRNAVHHTLSGFYGSTSWYDLPRVLEPRQHQEATSAKAQIQQHGDRVNSGRVVAELSFGFWSTLLSRRYDRIWRTSNARLLKHAFPHVPRRLRQRVTIHDRYNEIRLLRNRVFHFEPLWNRTDLADRHREVAEAIGWISPRLHDTIALIDRFPDVLVYGRGRIEAVLIAHLGRT